MNTALWAVQVLFALVFGLSGGIRSKAGLGRRS